MIQPTKGVRNFGVQGRAAQEVREALEVQQDVIQWSRETFPDQSLIRLTAHLWEEVHELNQAIADENLENVREEIADCAILATLFMDYLTKDVAPHFQTTITQVVKEKMVINKQRQWAFDPEKGYDREVENPFEQTEKMGLEVVQR